METTTQARIGTKKLNFYRATVMTTTTTTLTNISGIKPVMDLVLYEEEEDDDLTPMDLGFEDLHDMPSVNLKRKADSMDADIVYRSAAANQNIDNCQAEINKTEDEINNTKRQITALQRKVKLLTNHKTTLVAQRNLSTTLVGHLKKKQKFTTTATKASFNCAHEEEIARDEREIRRLLPDDTCIWPNCINEAKSWIGNKGYCVTHLRRATQGRPNRHG